MEEVEEIRPASPVNAAMKFGAYAGVAIVLSYVLNMFLTGRFIPWLRLELLVWAIFIVFMILGIRYHRDRELGGYISFWKATGTGILISLFSGMIVGIFWYLYLRFFLSDAQIELYKQQTHETSQALVAWLVSFGGAKTSADTDSLIKQSEEGIKMSRNSLALAMFKHSIFAKTPIGAFFSLLSSAFLMRRRPAIL